MTGNDTGHDDNQELEPADGHNAELADRVKALADDYKAKIPNLVEDLETGVAAEYMRVMVDEFLSIFLDYEDSLEYAGAIEAIGAAYQFKTMLLYKDATLEDFLEPVAKTLDTFHKSILQKTTAERYSEVRML